MAHGAVDLEAEYNNRARVPDHPAHIAGWHRDAEAYRAIASCELDIAYGSDERQRIDLFHPKDGNVDSPVVMFIHGGYWQALDKSSASHLARGANERGLTVAVPGYRLAPRVSLADIVADLEAAANFVFEHTRRPLVVTGHSAGGHLTACLMAKRSALRRPVRAALAISGLFELAPLVPTSINRALGLDESEARRLSPVLWPAPMGGTFIAAVGGAESSEYLRQSRSITERWARNGVHTRYHEVPGAHHFDVIAGLADPEDPLVDMLMDLSGKA